MKTLRTSQLLALHSEFVPEFMAGSGDAGAMSRHGADSPSSPGSAVSVISMVGGLRNRSFYGGGMAAIRDALTTAANDPKIKSIILDVDSPGGTVAGTPETAQVMREAAAIKPVIVSVNGMAASAAYWIASNATQVFVSPSSQVGSIGVFAAHTDFSALDESMGVKTTLISAGKFKVEGNPYEPLDAVALAEIQRHVDEDYDAFVADVAEGRGTTSAKVKADFGQGRMVSAVEAVRRGMADGVAPLEQVIAGQLAGVTRRAGRSASVFNW